MASAKSSESRPAGHSGVFPVGGAALGVGGGGGGGGDGGVHLADKLKTFKTDNFDHDAYVQSKSQTMNEKAAGAKTNPCRMLSTTVTECLLEQSKKTRERPKLPAFLDGVSKERIFFWSLIGDRQEVLEDYDDYVKSARKSGFEKGVNVKADEIFGRDKIMYTTPNTNEPVYAVVYSEDALVVFIIQADEWYQRGYYVDGQLYEIIPDNDKKPFIKGAQMLKFGGNYMDVCDGKPGELLIGRHVLEDRLKQLKTVRGRLERRSFALFTIYLCEGPKFKHSYSALRESLKYTSISRLCNSEAYIDALTVNWRFLSRIILIHVHNLDIQLTEAEMKKWEGIQGCSTLKETMETIRMVYVKALAKDGIPADPNENAKKNAKYRPKSAHHEIIQRGGATRSTYHTDSLCSGLKTVLSDHAPKSYICSQALKRQVDIPCTIKQDGGQQEHSPFLDEQMERWTGHQLDCRSSVQPRLQAPPQTFHRVTRAVERQLRSAALGKTRPPAVFTQISNDLPHHAHRGSQLLDMEMDRGWHLHGVLMLPRSLPRINPQWRLAAKLEDLGTQKAQDLLARKSQQMLDCRPPGAARPPSEIWLEVLSWLRATCPPPSPGLKRGVWRLAAKISSPKPLCKGVTMTFLMQWMIWKK